MLGKFKAPDSVEVAWAIPFISKSDYVKELEDSNLIKIEDMKTGAYVDEYNRPYYRSEFKIIEELALWKRNTENEQSIGRPRFLFHNVAFYVVTKDDISRYGIFKKKRRNTPQLKPYIKGDIIHNNQVNSLMLPIAKVVECLLKKSDVFSKDDVLDLLEEYAKPYDKIKWIRKTEGRKAEDSVNKIIRKYLNQHYSNRWKPIRVGNKWHYQII